MKCIYIYDREGLKRDKMKCNAATRPFFETCPECGRAFFGGGVCRRCRKSAHINRGENVRHV